MHSINTPKVFACKSYHDYQFSCRIPISGNKRWCEVIFYTGIASRPSDNHFSNAYCACYNAYLPNMLENSSIWLSWNQYAHIYYCHPTFSEASLGISTSILLYILHINLSKSNKLASPFPMIFFGLKLCLILIKISLHFVPKFSGSPMIYDWFVYCLELSTRSNKRQTMTRAVL